MRKTMALTILTLIFASTISPRLSHSSASSSSILPVVSPTVVATRITNKSAPLIDGVLEDIWQQAGQVTFPNSDGGSFSPSEKTYLAVNPSTFTVYYLHDDFNLYIAIRTRDDSMVESSALDPEFAEESDGLGGMALERKSGSQKACDLPSPCDANTCSLFRLLWHRDNLSPCTSISTGPPLDRDRMVFDAEWRSTLNGTWNNNADTDGGYTFELSIPLGDPVSGCAFGLGGWRAGDRIRTNIVLIDHDSKPGARYNDSEVNFRKCWWGSDSAERLWGATPEEDARIGRYILLSDGPPLGDPGNDMTVTARHIDSSLAPVIDGDLKESIWQQAGKLRFPNSVGHTFSISSARYNSDDPSVYTVYFLHDDAYLYIGFDARDRRIEAAGPTKDDDQASDGPISILLEDKGGGGDKRYSTYWHELNLWERHDLPSAIRECDGTEKALNVNLHFQEGPPRYPDDTRNVTFAPLIRGSWNDNGDTDAGYMIEYRIPLERLANKGVGYRAGDRIPANIVIIDHDNNPFGAFNDCLTDFKKFWWGFDGNEFYPPDSVGNPGARRPIAPEEERFIVLDSSPPITAGMLQLNPASRAADYVVRSQVPYSGLLRSFPDEPVAHTYDNAVALILLTDAGRRAEAQRLADGLLKLLEVTGDQGFFYDAYNAIDAKVGQGTTSGTGPNAWAAFALAYFGRTYDDQAALDGADKVARWVLGKLYDSEDGGIWGGICHPFEEMNGDHSGDVRLPFKSTEQVIDTWHLLRITGHPEVDRLTSWMMMPGRGWIDRDPGTGGCVQDNRFSTGVNETCKPDARIFLDPQSWGSILANLAGEPQRARQALEAAEKQMAVATVKGQMMIQGFGDSCLPKHPIIWYGGTAQMIVAYVFSGDLESAKSYLESMQTAQNGDGSWDHSSASILESTSRASCDSYESFHTARPSLGEIAWNYFAYRDVIDGWKLPYLITTLRITAAEVDGKRLTVTGVGFEKGAKILVNGEEQKTKSKTGGSSVELIAKKAGKRIGRGQSVVLQVVNPDSKRSPEFVFTND